MVRALYDGWPLLHRPEGPAALHLLALLAHLPDEVEPLIALPGEPPGWLPEVATLVEPVEPVAYARLNWEQRLLPRLAHREKVDLLHLTSPAAPLFGWGNCVVSPSGYEAGRPEHFAARLGGALAQGGLARARALFWPSDLPAPRTSAPLVKLPPVVHPDFLRPEVEREVDLSRLELPETYVLYHGPGDELWLRRILEAWSWAAGSVGAYYPLLILGLEPGPRRRLSEWLDQVDLGGTVLILPPLVPPEIPALYRRASALFHPAPVTPWGGPVRHALASGAPVVALDTGLSSAMVGPAAYLVPGEDDRAMGAALITVIVEDEVREQLLQSAAERVQTWGVPAFGRALLEAYHKLS